MDHNVLCTFYYTQANLFSIDWNGPIALSDDDNIVQVVRTPNPLQEEDFQELQATISPISESDCQGVDLFIRTLEFIHHKLTN